MIKKLSLAVVILLVIALTAVYVFIPSRLKVTESTVIKVSINAANRILLDENKWHQWWPGTETFTFNNQKYRLNKVIFNGVELEIFFSNDSLTSQIQLVPVKIDSTAFEWSGELNNSINPVKRFFQYRKAVTVKQNMNVLLSSLNKYLGNEINIYGFSVKEIKVTDSVLISTHKTFDHYPNNEEVEKVIQKLRNYIKVNKGNEKNFPMLNVLQLDSNEYEARVAISTDKKLAETKDFEIKMVFKGGNILETEIKGGPYTIRKAVNQFEIYKNDYQKTSPAIPYQLLVTDRTKETDTMKWITKLYYPVF